MTELSPQVADDRNRFDMAVSLTAELLRIVDAVARGPAGRHFRHCRTADGRPLFAWAKCGTNEVIVAPALLELVDALRRSRPDAVCSDCHGEQCPACRHAGYLPADRSLLAADPVTFERPAVDVSEIWRDGME